MPSSNVDIILRARDEATASLQKVTGSMESLTSAAGRMASGLRFGALGPGGLLAGAAAATAAALVNSTKLLAEQVEQLDNLSAASGVSAQRLQVLQFAFAQGGVDAAALSQGLNFLNKAIANNDPALAQLGVTSRDTFEAFLQAARGIASTDDAAERARRTFEVFGRGGAQLIPVLEKLAAGYDGIAGAAQRSGQVLSDEQLARLEKLDQQFDSLALSVEGWGKQLAVAVAGPMVAFIERAGEMKTTLEKLAAGGFGRIFARTGPHVPDQPREEDGTGPTDSTPFSTHGRVFGPGNDAGIREFYMQLMGGEQAGFSSAVNDSIKLRVDELRKLFQDGLAVEVPTVLDESAQAFLRFSETVRGAFDEIGRHVYSGFYGVLMNLTNRTQTLGSAMKTIWQSIVTGIQSAIAQLLSSAAVAGFLKLLGLALTALTGNAGFAMAGDWAAGGAIGMGRVVSTGPDATTMMRAPVGGNVTYVIQTIAPGEVLQSLTSGAMRTANSRLIEIAAAS